MSAPFASSFEASEASEKRLHSNTSVAWKTTFPRLYDFWDSKPCEAGGIIVKDNVVCFADTSLVSQPGRNMPPLNTSGTVVRNNTWVPSVCGPRPSPTPPPAPTPTPTPTPTPPLNVAAHHGPCTALPAAVKLRYNATNGAIFVAAGALRGRVVAVFWGDAGADHSPVTINPVDGAEFTQYKNVVFDIVTAVAARAPGRVEIKLRVNGKCLTAPPKLPGQVVLMACASGDAAQKWALQPVGPAAAKTWALAAGSGCAVAGGAAAQPRGKTDDRETNDIKTEGWSVGGNSKSDDRDPRRHRTLMWYAVSNATDVPGSNATDFDSAMATIHEHSGLIDGVISEYSTRSAVSL